MKAEESYKGYIPTIGLEIHAELRTETKMFCNSKNDTDEKIANVNICPVCMGYPGTLPTLNKQAIKHVLRLGVAVNGEISNYTEFDRKNYFYPDIPKGYQISQNTYPLIRGGELAGVTLTRVHLEEDTAKSTHDTRSDDSNSGQSLLDFNRAGVPLMELVTEPVIHDATTASKFAKELQLLLVYIGASHANMEKGEMRVEANISVSKVGDADTKKLGTKVEVKNLNSFKAVEKSIAFEIKRHIELLEGGGSVKQETRGWDENKEITFSQRAKEDSHDYRYFPEPDLPKLEIGSIKEFSKESLLKELPELPEQKRERFSKDFGLKSDDIEIYIRDIELAKFFEASVSELKKEEIITTSNYIISDLSKLLKDGNVGINQSKLTSDSMKGLMLMVHDGELSSRGAKDILKIIFNEGGDARGIADRLGLIQKNDIEELKKIVTEIINNNLKVVEEYKEGNTNSIQYLVGQAMKATKGSGNPQILKNILEDMIK